MRAQIVLENVGVRFPNRVLFEPLNFTLYEGMRIALAGRNGSGKSTLLKILAGKSEPPEGRRNTVGGRKIQIGFLDQSLLDSAVLDATQSEKAHQTPVEVIVRELSAAEAEGHEVAEEWEIRKLLSGLGFTDSMMDHPLSQLSGGWMLRVFIALALAQKPEILLLDEPTNHLDLASVQWLEKFLQRDYKGTLVLITHDIELQKRVTNALAVLHGGRFFYRPQENDYLTFLHSLSDEKRLIEKAIESNEKKMAENRLFAERFRAKATLANRAQSKLKAADKMDEETQNLRDRLAMLEGFSYKLEFQFRMGESGSKFPVSVEEVSFQYSDAGPEILRNLRCDLKRGQRVAILGDNGTGKTTLLNLVAGRLKPTSGNIQLGAGISIGYFGQHQLDELNLEGTLLENLRTEGTGPVSEQRLRGWLGSFGFPGSDVDKKARVLSGGERARLALLRILVRPTNLCLLDEPTNHLDIETKELLLDAMREFPGTLLFVSHDRDFVGPIADRILYLTRNLGWIDHPGDLRSFLEKYSKILFSDAGPAAPQPSTPAAAAPSRPALSFEERKKIRNQMKSLERKIDALETELDAIGQEKHRLEAQLVEAPKPDLLDRVAALEASVKQKMLEWEKFSTELERLRTIAG